MASIVLTRKHVAILCAFHDSPHYAQPRKNCRVHVWDEATQTVVFDIDHLTNSTSPYRSLDYEVEWRQLKQWGLIEEYHTGHPIYQLTREARIYYGG